MTVLPTQNCLSSRNFKHEFWITFFPSKTLLQTLAAIWVVALIYYNCVFPKVNICGSLNIEISCDITTNTKRINKIHKNKTFTNNIYLHLLKTFCEISSKVFKRCEKFVLMDFINSFGVSADVTRYINIQRSTYIYFWKHTIVVQECHYSDCS